MPWKSWLNAEIYDRFVRERPIYAWLNRRLVEIADVAAARRVLDLGCGTGATTIACLRILSPRAEIVGIDASREMIEVARANVRDPRARFEVAAAGEVDRLPGTFDRVVCNAAFWQFPAAGTTLRAVAARTRPGARFVFDVPAERVVGEPAPVHPFQVALLAAIETEIGAVLDAAPSRLDLDALARTAAESRFAIVARERLVYEGRQDELIELMSIPAMIAPLTPGLDDRRREAVIRRAAAAADPRESVTVPWVFVTLERRR